MTSFGPLMNVGQTLVLQSFSMEDAVPHGLPPLEGRRVIFRVPYILPQPHVLVHTPPFDHVQLLHWQCTAGRFVVVVVVVVVVGPVGQG